MVAQYPNLPFRVFAEAPTLCDDGLYSVEPICNMVFPTIDYARQKAQKILDDYLAKGEGNNVNIIVIDESANDIKTCLPFMSIGKSYGGLLDLIPFKCNFKIRIHIIQGFDLLRY